MNLPAYPTASSRRIPGIKPKKRDGSDSARAWGSATGLAITVSLPGNRFYNADANQQGCGEREQNGPCIEREASGSGRCGHKLMLRKTTSGNTKTRVWIFRFQGRLREGTSDNNNRRPGRERR